MPTADPAPRPDVDVVIVGGGPAGLSAALTLGRCRRRVRLFDTGQPRNAASKALHGFITRDGTNPHEFLRLAREELARYPNVELRSAEVAGVERRARGFRVRTASGDVISTRIVLLATGLVDELPALEGVEKFYGRSVHHCPYCDGWEHRDQRLAIYGRDEAALELAIEVRQWSPRIFLCTDGAKAFTDEESARLRKAGIVPHPGRIERLEGTGDALERIIFRDANALECSALFFSPKQRQHSPLASGLGCTFNDEGQIECGERQCTSVPGVYAVGNAARGLQLVIIAAAEGTKAAFDINEALCEADFGEG